MCELVTLKHEHDCKSVNAANPKRMSLHYLRYAVIPWSTTCPLDTVVACVECHNTFHHLTISVGSTLSLRISMLICYLVVVYEPTMSQAFSLWEVVIVDHRIGLASLISLFWIATS
jgi:hypothetical protein